VLLRLLMGRQLEPGGCGLVRGAHPPLMSGGELLVGYRKSGLGGHGEDYGVAVAMPQG
jgi:hypothetical protein